VGGLTSFAGAPRRRIGCAAIFAAPRGRLVAGHPYPAASTVRWMLASAMALELHERGIHAA